MCTEKATGPIVDFAAAVRKVIAEEAEVPVDQVVDEAFLVKDLEIGLALGMVEFLDLQDRLEKALGIKIVIEESARTIDSLQKVRVVDVINYVRSLISPSGAVSF